MEAPFFRLDEIRPFPLADGVAGQPVFGGSVMVNVATLEPGAVVAEHSHPHEQLCVVLRGTMVQTIDGLTVELRPMEGFAIAGGVPHSARSGPDGAVVLDVFQPVREDYRDLWTGSSTAS